MPINRLASAFVTILICLLANYHYAIVTGLHDTFLSASSTSTTTFQQLVEDLEYAYLNQQSQPVSRKEAISTMF